MEIPLDPVRFVAQNGEVVAVLALEAYPAVAEKIGMFFAAWGVIELTTRDLLAKALNISQEEATSILKGLRTPGGREELVKAISATEPKTELKARIADHLGEMSWATKERNKYAHAFYACPQDDSDRRLIRVAYFSDDRKTLYDEMTVAKVEADIERAKSLAVRLWDLLR